MHSEIDEPGIPSGIAIFGSDDSTKEYYMLYLTNVVFQENMRLPWIIIFGSGGEMIRSSRNALPVLSLMTVVP